MTVSILVSEKQLQSIPAKKLSLCYEVPNRYSSGGISVCTYDKRVRISVPNCNELTLIFCEEHKFQAVAETGEFLPTSLTNNIKFVVMRGLNHGHRLAHGLIGKDVAMTSAYINPEWEESMLGELIIPCCPLCSLRTSGCSKTAVVLEIYR